MSEKDRDFESLINTQPVDPSMEEINLLEGLLQEVDHLRRQNEQMSARLLMYDEMMLMFKSNAHPRPSEGMCYGPIEFARKKLAIMKMDRDKARWKDAAAVSPQAST